MATLDIHSPLVDAISPIGSDAESGRDRALCGLERSDKFRRQGQEKFGSIST